MNKAKKTIITTICLFCFVSVFSQTKIADKLQYKEKAMELTLYPKGNLGSLVPSIWEKYSDKSPIFISEIIFEFPLKENSMESVSKILRSFSTMEGLEYYSNSKGKNEILYPNCYTVDNPTSRKKIPDQIDGSSNNKTIYMFQEDNSFGKTLYEVNYLETENEILFTAINLDPLSVGFIKAVKPYSLLITIAVEEESDRVSVYLSIQANFASFSLVDKTIQRSLTSRVDAIAEWFKRSYFESK